jgi:NAD(P)-dependent dehydrogenase (short-subunit alcohol dehydrogenase family)
MKMDELFSLDGKVALITGGSGAIGQGAAQTFIDLGGRVILAGRTAAHLEAARAALPQDAEVVTVLGDAGDEAHVQELVEVAAAHGGVDILVNSVGTNRRKPILEATTEDLEFLWRVNMASVWAVTQALVPQMVVKGYGKIINMCSIGSFVGLEYKTMYAITKGALAQHTRSAALELAQYGIRVNGLAPGYVDTPMTHAWIHSEREAEYLARIPLRKYAEVEDLKGSFALLASRASDHITGQIITIDGGETIW